MQKNKDIFGKFDRSDFSSWMALKTSPIVGWLGFVVVCLAITFLMTFSISNIPSVILPGMIAEHDVRADRNYEIEDEHATKKFREEAVAAVPDVYDYDADMGRRIAEKNSAAFAEMRSKIVSGEKPAKAAFDELLGIVVADETWSVLLSQGFAKPIENAINNQVSQAMSRPVVSDVRPLHSEKNNGITLREGESSERILNAREIGNIVSIEDAQRKAKKDSSVASAVAPLLVQPNIAFNMQETEDRKARAADNVKSVVIKVEVGEVIVRVGSRYEPRHVIILNGIRAEKERAFTPLKSIGTFILVALVIICTYYFAKKYIRKFAPQKTDLYFMGIVLIFIMIVLRISLATARGIYDSFGMNVPVTAFYYAIPVSGAAMLIRFILNSETALVFSVVSGIFAGVFVGNSLDYAGFCFISSIVAAASIAQADKRSSIIRAGFYTSAANALAVVSIVFINANSLTASLNFWGILWHVLFAVIGGLASAAFVTILTPVVETIFGYTTDIKLLELANLNHPLLRELVIRAPGTYHHSHLVGILAEAASEAVGANPLLTRVAAYYHDIGKIKKPLYFVENTTDCESRHEKLSPHMSALIISSHIKEGLELATEYKVPKKITDMIPQHHGTKMIGFFYEKALKQMDPSIDKIDEKDFRYSGPKPQTREAGILLLADAVEAAVRSLKEKSPARIQQMVEDVINSSFIEAQLDECDLTLKNLHDIAKSFTKILMGIYHQRIEYPKETLETGAVKNG